jgi:hypothetical protein
MTRWRRATAVVDRPQLAGKEAAEKEGTVGVVCLVFLVGVPACTPSLCHVGRLAARLPASARCELVALLSHVCQPALLQSPSDPGAHHPPGRARRQEPAWHLPSCSAAAPGGHRRRRSRTTALHACHSPAASPWVDSTSSTPRNATRTCWRAFEGLPVSLSKRLSMLRSPPDCLAVLAMHAPNGVLGSSRTGYGRPAHQVRPPSPLCARTHRPKPRSQHVPDRLRPAPGRSG